MEELRRAIQGLMEGAYTDIPKPRTRVGISSDVSIFAFRVSGI